MTIMTIRVAPDGEWQWMNDIDEPCDDAPCDDYAYVDVDATLDNDKVDMLAAQTVGMS